MRTVMIVDDEKLVRVGLKSIIDWERYGYEIIGVYKNGMEAWQSIENCCPDILLTDIRMPKMDGFELIEKVRAVHSNVNVIILSSYEDYEYTRKAIQMNVHDYLIKHELDPKEIIRVLNRLTYTNSQTHEHQKLPLSQEKARFLMFTKDYLVPHNDGESWELSFPLIFDYCNELQKKGKLAWIVFQTTDRKENYIESELKVLSSLIDETLSRLNSFYVGSDQRKYHGIICLNHLDDNPIQLARKIADEIIHTSRDVLNIDLFCGISTFTSQISVLPHMRSDAEEALQLFFFHGTGVYFKELYNEPKYFSESEWVALNNSGKGLLYNQDFDKLNEWILLQIESFQHLHPNEAVRFCEMVIYRFIDYILERYQIDLTNPSGEYEIVKYHSLMKTASSWNELFEITLKAIQVGRNLIEVMHDKKGWIVKTLEYIEHNYNKPLRLEDAAGHVNFSVNYFSQRFHQETGFLFSDYLMKYRINKAKELYIEGKLSTEAIAVEVGYLNTNYFTRVFKKVTGTTISEFKRNI